MFIQIPLVKESFKLGENFYLKHKMTPSNDYYIITVSEVSPESVRTNTTSRVGEMVEFKGYMDGRNNQWNLEKISLLAREYTMYKFVKQKFYLDI